MGYWKRVREALIGRNLWRIKAKCGHKTRLSGWLFGKRTLRRTKLVRDENGSVDYCFHCLSKMSITCGRCGGDILISDPIILFVLDEVYDQAQREASIYVAGDSSFLIGCLKEECHSAEAYYIDFWVPCPGALSGVPKVLSAQVRKIEENPFQVVEVSSFDELAEFFKDEKLKDWPSQSNRVH